MTQIQNDNRQDRNEAAIRWQARLMSGAITEAERAEFEGWLSASELNRLAFDELEDALDAVDGASAELLAAEFESELEARADARSGGFVQYAAIAASLILICAAVLTVRLQNIFPQGDLQYATAVGEMEKVGLKDGSTVELNTKSAIAVAFSRDRREVRLDGGTVFDVDVFEGESIVSVVSGVVDVRPKAGSPVTLLAGDRVVVYASGAAGAVERFDANQALAWRIGKLRFRDAPLGEVIEDLNRYFAKPISLASPDLANLPVTGEFSTGDQSAAVSGISLSFSLQAREGPDRIVLMESEG